MIIWKRQILTILHVPCPVSTLFLHTNVFSLTRLPLTTYLDHLFPLCRGEPLSLVQVDLGLVEPGADVSQVLIEYFHFILVTLQTYNEKTELCVSIRNTNMNYC